MVCNNTVNLETQHELTLHTYGHNHNGLFGLMDAMTK